MKREYAREAFILLMNQISDARRHQAGYEFENMFVSWYWGKRPGNRWEDIQRWFILLFQAPISFRTSIQRMDSVTNLMRIIQHAKAY